MAHMTQGTTLLRASVANWATVRDVRLRALRDAPNAFGATYEREAEFTEADWTRRLTGEGVTFLAKHPRFGPEAIGICGGYPRDADVVELVSMWVDPRARGLGVAEPLVKAVVEWASSHGATHLHLWVTEGNQVASRLYERCGFVLTGERQPLPSNLTLLELGMVCTLR